MFHKIYHILTPEEIDVDDRFDRIESPVNKMVTTGNPTELTTYYTEYRHLLSLLGPTSLIYNETYDCAALMDNIDKLINFDVLFDGILNLYDEILTMPELSDAHFTLVARRYLFFSSLIGDLDSSIGVQKKLVERFPRCVAELSKLGEMQYAVGHKLEPQDVFEKVHELDQYIGENLPSNQLFCNPPICFMV